MIEIQWRSMTMLSQQGMVNSFLINLQLVHEYNAKGIQWADKDATLDIV